MKFFRQGAHGLAEQNKLFGQQGPFSGTGFKHAARKTHKIADIKVLEKTVDVTAHTIFADIGL